MVLEHIRTLTEITKDETAREAARDDAENALSTTTLQKLASGAAYPLRASALRIVANRGLNPQVKDTLLLDLASKDDTHRDRAIKTLIFLFESPALSKGNISNPNATSSFTDPKSLCAIITALINILPLHGPQSEIPYTSPIFPSTRPAAERQLLPLLNKLMYHLHPLITPLLNAGLVSRYLAIYPFPCALPQHGARKEDVCSYFNSRLKSWSSDDPVMSQIVSLVYAHPQGYAELQAAGFVGKSRYCGGGKLGGRRGKRKLRNFIESGAMHGIMHDDGDSDSAEDEAGEEGPGIVMREWGWDEASEASEARADPGGDEGEEEADDNDVLMLNGEETAGTTLSPRPLASNPPTTVPRPRTSRSLFDRLSGLQNANISPEEARVRRRRREAMILSDDNEPLSERNLLQRADSAAPMMPVNSSVEVDRQLALLSEEIDREDAVANAMRTEGYEEEDDHDIGDHGDGSEHSDDDDEELPPRYALDFTGAAEVRERFSSWFFGAER